MIPKSLNSAKLFIWNPAYIFVQLIPYLKIKKIKTLQQSKLIEDIIDNIRHIRDTLCHSKNEIK
uniref:Uncharacterized protein n=1 Tax=Rhizophora mucronata TaxID=61149 RepID=A0A2P2LM19_RHIMU